jgi:DNA-binding GntR family transcriptional regulator
VHSPAYRQIADDLRRRIRAGEFAPGDRLPTRKQLAAHYRVSDQVPVSAIRVLAAEGLVESRHGSGTYVLQRPPVQQVRRAWNDPRLLPPPGTTSVTETVSAQLLKDDNGGRYRVPPGTPVLVITRTCWAGTKPLASFTLPLPAGSEAVYEVRPPQ